MGKKNFQASHEVLAATPLGPIVEFSFRGEDDVSRGHKISTFLEEHLAEIQPAAVLLNFLDCRHVYDSDVGGIIPAFIDRNRGSGRPCAVLAGGRAAKSMETMLELTTIAESFRVKVFDNQDSAVTYLHDSLST